jgi:DNA-binding response OmpR family regulator
MDRDDKITIAGPDPDLLQLMERYLRARGFRCVEIANTQADEYWIGQVPDMRMEQQVIHIHGITIDKAGREAWIDDRKLDIKPKVWSLLAFLAENAGVVLHRDIILDSVWGYDSGVGGRTVDTHIRWIRKALGDKADIIRTESGVGYSMEREG